MHSEYNEDFCIAIFSFIITVVLVLGYINVHKIGFLLSAIFCGLIAIFELYVAIKLDKDNK